jgi:hypothetical protein
MADEKIVVVCDDNCGKCRFAITHNCVVKCLMDRITKDFINKGDVVTIEIKRAVK